MKKIISAAAALIMIFTSLFALSSCDSDNNGKKTIAVIQFGSHASLNNCYDGVIRGLEENGYTSDNCKIEHVNSNFDSSLAQSQANAFVNSRADVIIAVATPSAVAAANASNGDIPVVYCAITDSSVMNNYENVTGSSDIPNFEKQLEVVTSVMGREDIKIGVLYSSEESSSPIQVSEMKRAAEAYSGMEIIDTVVSDITTIDAKVESVLERGADCLINILDNTIVGKLETNILTITNEKGIPVFGSEIEQVKVGCAASASIEYIDVGRKAGEAAAMILNGKAASEIPISVVTEPAIYYNSEVISRLGLNTPEGEDVAE